MYQYQIRADEGSVIEKGTYCYNYYILSNYTLVIMIMKKILKIVCIVYAS